MKKYIFLLTSSLFIFSISAQDIGDLTSLGGLDKDYLDSLPDDIKGDLLDKVGAKKEMDQPIYRRGSSTIDKPETELDKLNKSKRFGSKIFDTMQSSFMPINVPNIDNNYVLGVGDELEIQLTGGKDAVKNYIIKNDGSININEIGKLYLAGLPLLEASNIVKAKVEKAYTLTNAYITLTNMRNIQILVSGNTFNPGIYTLNGNSNALHAITMAGGINDDGSYRVINIIRDNKIIESLDLYDIFVHGKSNFGPRLRSGDSVFVSPYKMLVNVFSGVKRPAQYELKENETFKDLLLFANGLTSNADLSSIAFERIKKGNIELSAINEIDELSSIKVKDGDTLFIKEFNIRTVTLKGAVTIPGDYKITEGETLSSLIKRAGGYKPTAYPFGGFLENKQTLEINLEVKDKLYNNFLETLLLKIQIPGDSLPYVLHELKKSPVSGRVMAEFDLDLISENTNLDTTLQDKDSILIPYITQQVYVYGEVNNSGAIRYMPNKGVNYYINNAGGIKRSSDKKNIYVVNPNGATSLIQTNNLLSKLSPEKQQLIYPGSIIFVPRNTSLDTAQSAAIWGPIISSLALSLTSLSVLDKN
jgi:polysaccharide biosynthesis/export protein